MTILLMLMRLMESANLSYLFQIYGLNSKVYKILIKKEKDV